MKKGWVKKKEEREVTFPPLVVALPAKKQSISAGVAEGSSKRGIWLELPPKYRNPP